MEISYGVLGTYHLIFWNMSLQMQMIILVNFWCGIMHGLSIVSHKKKLCLRTEERLCVQHGTVFRTEVSSGEVGSIYTLMSVCCVMLSNIGLYRMFQKSLYRKSRYKNHLRYLLSIVLQKLFKMFAILFDRSSATFSYAINNGGASIFVPIHVLNLCLNDRS
jgi:hypothetical protein